MGERSMKRYVSGSPVPSLAAPAVETARRSMLEAKTGYTSRELIPEDFMATLGHMSVDWRFATGAYGAWKMAMAGIFDSTDVVQVYGFCLDPLFVQGELTVPGVRVRYGDEETEVRLRALGVPLSTCMEGDIPHKKYGNVILLDEGVTMTGRPRGTVEIWAYAGVQTVEVRLTVLGALHRLSKSK